MALSNLLNELINPTNALGQIGKALSQASGGPWGDALTLLDKQKLSNEENLFDRRYKQAQIDALERRDNRVQGVALGEGGYASFNPDTGAFNVLREPTKKDTRPNLAQQFDWYRSLGPADQKLASRLLPNYGLTEDGIAATIQRTQGTANAQGAARAAYRAPSAGRLSPYGRSKGNPLPVSSKADYDRLPAGSWVSPAPGVVFQKR